MAGRVLWPDELLEQSGVVADDAMNRQRGLAGLNSYERRLGFNPIGHLGPGSARLDLCAASAAPSSGPPL